MPFLYYGFGVDWTLFLVLPGILLAMVAQYRVKSVYNRYQKVQAGNGLSAQGVARQLLDKAGLDIPIDEVPGQLSDHYNPRSRSLGLSAGVSQSGSVAAIGVAAHEVGHAVQHAEGYWPFTLRNAIYPVVNIASQLAIPLLLLGLVLELFGLISIALVMYSSAIIFQVVTLPVEFNASRRAKAMLAAEGILSNAELEQAGKVLNAAALTYVASLLLSILQLMRLMAMAGRRRR